MTEAATTVRIEPMQAPKRHRRPDRLESNEELMHQAVRKRGRVAIRVTFQIRGVDGYVGFRGRSIVVQVLSPGLAHQIPGAIADFLREWKPR